MLIGPPAVQVALNRPEPNLVRSAPVNTIPGGAGNGGGGAPLNSNTTVYRSDDGAVAGITDTASGLRIQLTAPSLPALPAGQFYQGWLKADDGRLVAIGSFHSGVDVTLWAGVSLTDFHTLTVTREPDDGNSASSGDRVLAIKLRP